MSSVLQQILNEWDQMTPEEQWEEMGGWTNKFLCNLVLFMILLQHRALLKSLKAKSDKLLADSADKEWDDQIANDLETGKLNHLIAKAEADIKANQVRDLNEVLRNP